MADKSIFGRLQKLFSTNTIIRKTPEGIKVIDTDEYQSMTTNLVDRFMKLKVSNYAGGAEQGLAYQQVRIDLFRDYDSMDMDPIISAALNTYSDECTARNEFGNVLKIHHFDPTNPQRVKFVYAPYQNPYNAVGQTAKKEYENYEIAHFRLNGDANFLPYGKSMIEGARRVWKQLSLMEDAMLIHRVMRAPEKRIFKIDVGNIPPNEVDNYMQKIINNSKKVPFVDERTGEYNLKYNIQNLIEDYYMPVRGSDSGTSIDTLKGLEYNMIDDINYLKGKMLAALQIPKAFLGYEEETNGKATLAGMDVRFAKTIERIQRIMISELTKIVQLIQQMQQTKMFSKPWMYEAIMGMAKDEQDDMTLQVLEDVKQQFRLTSIETQGVDPAKETGTEAPTNVEEEIAKIKAELDEEGVGRPKDSVRYGKDDHPEGRDPLGIKTLKQKEGSVQYKPRKNSYFEVFKDMNGGKKKILTENLDKE